MRKALGSERSTTLTCTCAHQSKNNGKHKVNRTKINRKRCLDTGIEPETSEMPGKRTNRYTTRTSTYSYALTYYKYTGKHNDASSKV